MLGEEMKLIFVKEGSMKKKIPFISRCSFEFKYQEIMSPCIKSNDLLFSPVVQDCCWRKYIAAEGAHIQKGLFFFFK